MLEFGLPQYPPVIPDDLTDIHKICCKKNKIKSSCGDKFQYHVQKWNQRHEFALDRVRYTHKVYPNRQYFQWYWNFFVERLYLSREVLMANPMARCGRILGDIPSNYPAAPETNMMPDADMWSDTHPPNSQFITPPSPYIDQSFNPSTNYNRQTNSYKTPQFHIQPTLNIVIMEKAPKYQIIHLMTLIQLKTPHKPITQPITIHLFQPTIPSTKCTLSRRKKTMYPNGHNHILVP